MSLDTNQRKERRRGSPFEDQREERSVIGTIVDVQPETCSCRVKLDEGGGVYESLPLPGLIQDSQGGGGEVFVPRTGQRVELKIGGQAGVRIRGYVPTPAPALLSESSTPSLFPENLPSNQRGRVNFRGRLPRNLVSGDWCRIGNQNQYIGCFDGGLTTLFGSPWAQINAIGGTNTDTINIAARRLKVLTGFGLLECKSENGRQSIEFCGGLDQMTETGYDQTKWTYQGGLGVGDNFHTFAIRSKGGDPIYRVNLGTNSNYQAFYAGEHIQTIQGDKGTSVNGGYWRAVIGNAYKEIGGDQNEVFKKSRTCRININDTVQIMGKSVVTIQGSRTVTCQTLAHNVSGSPTSIEGSTSYSLKVGNGSWDVEIGKLIPPLQKPIGSFNVTVFSPTGGINMNSKFGTVSINAGRTMTVKALTDLTLEGATRTIINGGVVTLGGTAVQQPVLKGQAVIQALQSFLNAIVTSAAGAPPTEPAIKGVAAAASALSAQLASWPSTKVFVT